MSLRRGRNLRASRPIRVSFRSRISIACLAAWPRIPNRFELDPIRHTQVLCRMNRGGVGARSLNVELRAALNPSEVNRIERFGWTSATGDKVMQIENDYDKDVYNGDIGYLESVDVDEGELTASIDGRSVSCLFGELDTRHWPIHRHTRPVPEVEIFEKCCAAPRQSGPSLGILSQVSATRFILRLHLYVDAHVLRLIGVVVRFAARAFTCL